MHFAMHVVVWQDVAQKTFLRKTECYPALHFNIHFLKQMQVQGVVKMTGDSNPLNLQSLNHFSYKGNDLNKQ